jgi:hypothetical protein
MQEQLWYRFWPWAQPVPGIDMGDGRKLGAEDVLESHFKRMAARRRPARANVAVQVGDSLLAAITVLAPNLAPLTELAEEVATVVPPVQPAPEFRRNLHQALERTHRQHSAQRVLGTRPLQQPETSWIESRSLWFAVAGALLTAALALLWRRRSAMPQAAG